VALGQNLESLKDFCKRIGSNLRLAGLPAACRTGRDRQAKAFLFPIKILGLFWLSVAKIQNGVPNGIRTRVTALKVQIKRFSQGLDFGWVSPFSFLNQ